jgi:hypothetical protein
MLDPNIADDEKLYIAVLPQFPHFWDKVNDRPASNLFKKKDGRSADREGGRQLPEIVERLIGQFTTSKKVAVVSAGLCREHEAYVVYAILEDNIYHCDILNSDQKDDLQLDNLKCKMLAKLCDWFYVEPYLK